MIEPKSAQNHRGGLQTEAKQKNEVIYVIIAPESFTPQENRVDHAQPVGDHGQEEKMSICEPSHGKGAYASAKCTQGRIRSTNPKPENRGPKEIRIPWPECVQNDYFRFLLLKSRAKWLQFPKPRNTPNTRKILILNFRVFSVFAVYAVFWFW